jgi:acyl carrier protein
MTEVVSGRPTVWSRDQVHAVIGQLASELAPAGTEGECNADAKLIDDLGYHSLALLELAFTIEDEFSLDPIDAETAIGIVTVGDVENYVSSKLQERGALSYGGPAAQGQDGEAEVADA